MLSAALMILGVLTLVVALVVGAGLVLCAHYGKRKIKP